jgi:hypothetical protein
MSRRMLAWTALAVAVQCVTLAWLVRAQGPFTFAGMDFLTTYTAAEIVAEGSGTSLYDTRVQWEYQRDTIARYRVDWSDRVMHPYIAPPPLALLALPLLWFGPAVAAVAWSLTNVLAVVAGLVLLVRRLDLNWRLAAIVVAGSFPLFYTVLLGQVEGLLFLALALFMVWLRAGHDARAGLALAMLALKPPLLLAAFVFLLSTRRQRVLAYATGAIAVQGLSSLAIVGPRGVRDFLDLSRRLSGPDGATVTNVWGMVNIRSVVVRLVPEHTHLVGVAIVVLTALVLYAAAWYWRTSPAPTQDLAALGFLPMTMVLTSYHALYHTSLLGLLGVLLLIAHLQHARQRVLADRLLMWSVIFFSIAPLASFLVVPTSKIPALLGIGGLLLCWCVTMGLALGPVPVRVPRRAEVPVQWRATDHRR